MNKVMMKGSMNDEVASDRLSRFEIGEVKEIMRSTNNGRSIISRVRERLTNDYGKDILHIAMDPEFKHPIAGNDHIHKCIVISLEGSRFWISIKKEEPIEA